MGNSKTRSKRKSIGSVNAFMLLKIEWKYLMNWISSGGARLAAARCRTCRRRSVDRRRRLVRVHQGHVIAILSATGRDMAS